MELIQLQCSAALKDILFCWFLESFHQCLTPKQANQTNWWKYSDGILCSQCSKSRPPLNYFFFLTPLWGLCANWMLLLLINPYLNLKCSALIWPLTFLLFLLFTLKPVLTVDEMVSPLLTLCLCFSVCFSSVCVYLCLSVKYFLSCRNPALTKVLSQQRTIALNVD